jgi:hypothetical protein
MPQGNIGDAETAAAVPVEFGRAESQSEDFLKFP